MCLPARQSSGWPMPTREGSCAGGGGTGRGRLGGRVQAWTWWYDGDVFPATPFSGSSGGVGKAGPWVAPGKGRAGALEAAAQGPPYRRSGVGCSLPIALAVFPLPLTRGCRASQAEPVPRLARPRSARRKCSGPPRGIGYAANSPGFPERPWFGEEAGPRQPGSAAPRSTPGRGAAMATGAPRRAAPRPAPLGVAGGPTGPGLSDPTARRRPRRDQDGGRRGSRAGAGSSGVCPLTAPS